MLFYFIMSLLGVVIFCVGLFVIANLVCHLEDKKIYKQGNFCIGSNYYWTDFDSSI